MNDQTKVSRVTEYLRGEILNKTFKAGCRITIKEICDRYGVSNIPVREAFRILESEKLLEISPYKGATVLNVNEKFISNVYGLLMALELLICESAFGTLNYDEDIKRLESINEEIGALKDNPEDRLRYIKLNISFHEAILVKGTNETALEQYRGYTNMVKSIRETYTPKFERIRAAYNEHKCIISAIEDRDASELKRAIDLHGKAAEKNFFTQFNSEK